MSELHKGVADRSIAMRVILHGVTHDVGHFVEAAVVESLHGMQNATLHRFQAVLDVGNGSLENYIAGIFKIPVSEHSGKNSAFGSRFRSRGVRHFYIIGHCSEKVEFGVKLAKKYEKCKE